MEANIIKRYNATLDGKKRLTIRGAQHEHYTVTVLKEGTVILKPQILVNLEDISEETLEMIRKSAENFKKGIVGEPIDLEKYNFDEDV